MSKHSIMIAQFHGDRYVHSDVAEWVEETVLKIKADSQFSLFKWRTTGTPITMLRNKTLLLAEQEKVDFCLMIDDDMSPDLPLPNAKPFWPTSIDFLLSQKTPSIIGAPYCMMPPIEKVNVCEWQTGETDCANPDFHLVNIARPKAAILTGIQEVAAIGTGLLLIDMRAIKGAPHPRFYYEYTDEAETAIASTEDITFTRDASYRGVKIFCNWDSWAGHHKDKLVGKPALIEPKDVSKGMWATARRELAGK